MGGSKRGFRRNRRASAKRKAKKVSGGALKAQAKRMALASAQRLFIQKSYTGTVTDGVPASPWTTKNKVTLQAIFQDIPLQITPSTQGPNQLQRLGAVIYMEEIRFSGLLFKAASVTAGASGNPN